MPGRFDIAVVGGGIVGLATARALIARGAGSLVVLEAEPELARHQTGHNSGVIHSGLYYRPGSLKAELCTAGRDALYALCAERGIAYERCGKLVLATRPEELGRLDELERRGRANGLTGLERLNGAGVREVEPHARGVAGLRVAETGIVDFRAVARAFAADVRTGGGEIRTSAALTGADPRPDHLALESAAGRLEVGALVNCAGLRADRIARLCGAEPDVRIVPFRGEYHTLTAERRHLVRHLIYPVPDPDLPFLGVHLTRSLDGAIEAGPNAVLALAREGYRWSDVSPRDLAEVAAWPGTWRMARRWWRVGLTEVRRSLSKRRFARDLARLVPEIRPRDLAPGGAGVRAQAVDRWGRLLDDFHLVEGERSLHVLNAPSPAATASIAIGEEIARRVEAWSG